MGSYREAEAIPYDSGKKNVTIKLRGRRNLRGVFDGDTVEVEVFDELCDGSDVHYGRALRVAERGRLLKFLCRVSRNNPCLFFPIDKKHPIFVTPSQESSNLVIVYPSRAHWKCIPLKQAQDMIFLISFLEWDVDMDAKYNNPIGKVIGSYPKAFTLKDSEELLKSVYSVVYSPDTDSNVKDPLQCHDQGVFTIDPEEAQNLDDALSIERVDTENCHEVYKLGVHIANAAKHIQPDTEVDKVAKQRGISMYGEERGKIMHMLPDAGIRRKLSLLPGEVRDVISVTCNVTISPMDLQFGECTISPARIKSAVQLTYEDAQCLIDGVVPSRCAEAERFLSLKRSMKVLFIIAKALRQKRLPSDAAFAYEVDNSNDAICWQSHLLVEELMIWTNSEVAKYIHYHYPDAALLNRQLPPQLSLKTDEGTMRCSLFLSQYLSDRNAVLPNSIVIPLGSLRQIQSALKNNDKTLLAHLMSADRLYPQFAAVRSKIRSTSVKAEYCCTEACQTDSFIYRHHSLCVDKYTHFTSPIRRYIDIEVQRMLLESKKKVARRREFSHRQHAELCSALNVMKDSAKQFQTKMKNVRLAAKHLATSRVCSIFMRQTKEKKTSVEVAFPDLELKHFPSRAKHLKLTDFVCASRKNDYCTWDLRITSLKDNLAKGLLTSTNLIHHYDTKCEGTHLTAYCFSDSSSLDIEKLVLRQPVLSVEVSSASWLEALKFVKDPTQKNMDTVDKLMPQLPPSSFTRNCASEKKEYAFLQCDVKAFLNESIFKVWLTGLNGTLREPVISPAIQLVEVSPLLRICLQHNSHPAECFSDPSLSQASRESYGDIQQYVHLWKKVLLAEIAEQSVRECQPIIIQDVLLQWPRFEEGFEDFYFLPSSEKVKMILPKKFIDHCYEFFKVSIGDFVCVRYGCNPKETERAVYHFVVNDVKAPKRKPDSITVSMESVGKWACRVSNDMRLLLESKQHTCEVQIISVNSSYR